MRHLRLVFIISIGVLALPLHRAVAQSTSEWLSSAPASDCDSKTEHGFFGRLAGAYADHLRITGTESGPDLAYRGASAPVSSPPFPFSTWPIGGTVSIGSPDTSGGPLMDAIYCGPYGQLIKDSRIKVYGWFDPGANFSTSNHSRFSFKQGVGGNNP